MSVKQQIILRYFREGHSQRRISRDLSVSRKTVQKYISAYSQSQSALQAQKKPEEELVEELVSKPRYDSSSRGKRRLTSEVMERIDALLHANEKKRQAGLHKQLLKKIDIFETLQEEGFQIGYTSVCSYIKEQMGRQKEAFIRQVYQPGSSCEFDWGEIKLEINGKRRSYYLAVFTSSYSNYRYAALFHHQDSSSFQQSHVQFFSHTKGVYHQLVYDNMRVAIRRFVGPKEKEPTEALLKLSSYYHFHFRFCNAGKGNEKGHVERSVEYIRRKAFSRQDSFSSLAAANTYLEQKCKQLNATDAKISDRFAQEQSLLYSAPAAFDCSRQETARVDKYATVMVASNRYSVPDHLVGELLQVRVYAETVKCYYGKEVVARHQRSYVKHDWVIELEHYLQTLRKKPGALSGSLALQNAEEQIKQLYEHHYQQQAKDFIELLLYMQKEEVSLSRIKEAIAQLQAMGCRQVTTDKLMVICRQKPFERPESPKGVIEEESHKQLHRLAQLFAHQ